jgi:hypothetical protein
MAGILMTTVRTRCPTCCLEVDVPSTEIFMTIREGDEEGTYLFVCGECEMVQDKPADIMTAKLLIAAECSWTIT